MTDLPADAPSLDAIRALHGRQFATLTDAEMDILNFYRSRGRRYSVAITFDTKADPAALAAASPQQTDQLLKAASTHIKVAVS